MEVLKTIPDKSIQLVVTSPPYDKLRTYQNNAVWNFEGTAHEIFRVLCDDGVACWNVNDMVIDGSETLASFRQAIFFKDLVGFRVHDTMIYEKSNGSKPDPTRYNPCMEYVFILSKGRPRCFNPIKDKKNVTYGKPCFGRHTMRERDGSMSIRKERKLAAEFGARSNVWKGKTRGQEDCCKNLPHPAMMPKWLSNDLIVSWSNPKDTVLDPFAGAGTVGLKSLENNRSAILIDISEEYCALAKETCSEYQSKLLA